MFLDPWLRTHLVGGPVSDNISAFPAIPLAEWRDCRGKAVANRFELPDGVSFLGAKGGVLLITQDPSSTTAATQIAPSNLSADTPAGLSLLSLLSGLLRSARN